MDSKLLVEYLPFKLDKNQINESINQNNGKLIVSGILQRCGAKNLNGRVYPRPVLEREIGRYTGTEIAQRRALGELDHRDSETVELKNVSHNILECWWQGDDLCGKIEILSTPAGNILKELFKAGITVGISSRGMGSVKPLAEAHDTMEVQNDFSLITFDFVSSPSTQGAFMKPIAVSESVGGKNITNNYSDAHTLVRDILCEMSGVCCTS